MYIFRVEYFTKCPPNCVESFISQSVKRTHYSKGNIKNIIDYIREYAELFNLYGGQIIFITKLDEPSEGFWLIEHDIVEANNNNNNLIETNNNLKEEQDLLFGQYGVRTHNGICGMVTKNHLYK